MLESIKKFFEIHDDVVALLVLVIGAILALTHHPDESKLTIGGGLALLRGKSTGNG